MERCLTCSYRRGTARRRRSHSCKALLEIPDQIVHRLGADRQTDCARSDPRGPQLLVVQLPMRGAGRMNDQALRVSDISEMRPERHAANEILSGRTAALAIKREHRAGAERQVLINQRTIAAVR